jgi:hypothetical protein
MSGTRALVVPVMLAALIGCAGGRARMIGTSPESAEDAQRLQAMLTYCIAPSGDGVVTPLVSITPQQAGDAATVYLRQYFWTSVQHDAPQPGTEMRTQVVARATTHANRVSGCMRSKYGLPVPSGAELVQPPSP